MRMKTRAIVAGLVTSAATLGVANAANAASSPQCIGSSHQCLSGLYYSGKSHFDANTSGSTKIFYLVVNGTKTAEFRGGTNFISVVSGRAFGKICQKVSGTDPCSALINT